MLFFNYVLRSLARRISSNALTVAVIGFVLCGCILGVSFLRGLQFAARESLAPEHVLVTGKGAKDEIQGALAKDTVRRLEVLPGIRTHAGMPAVSPEIISAVTLDEETTQRGYEEAQLLRGVDPIGFELHGISITEGRLPARGQTELVIGDQLRQRYPALRIGSKIQLPNEEWEVVGVFSANGSVFETEAWGDRGRMMTALKQEAVQSVLLVAGSVEDASALIARINNNKQFDVSAHREREFRGSQAKLAQVAKVILILVIALCVIGVFVVATNLHASLIGRLPELVTLIVLGVRRDRVATLVLLESMLLATIGLALAVAGALLVHGRSSSALTDTAIFPLHIGLLPLSVGAGLALSVGILGGLAPAMLVRRLHVINGLR